MNTTFKVFTLAFLILAVSNNSFGQNQTKSTKAKIPIGSVIDQEHILNQEQKIDLETKMKQFNLISKSPIAIFIAPLPKKVEPNKSWYVKISKHTAGVMIFLSTNHKEVRLGLSSELSKKISDEKANQFMQNMVLSYFQHGDYYNGLQKIIDELTELLK